VSLPRLLSFDWTLHLKQSVPSSSSLANTLRINTPVVRINLVVENACTFTNTVPAAIKDSESIPLELSKEALDTMLEGLGRIKDQLANMA
jgi:hypothetical protein